MDDDEIKRERHYGRVLMLIKMINGNEAKMQGTGFGFGFDWKEVAKWADCSNEELDNIRNICYWFSERGVRDAIIKDIAEGKMSSEILKNKSERGRIFLQKLEEQVRYVKNHYDYPEEVIGSALDWDFIFTTTL